MKYFEAKTVGGRGGVHVMKMAESMEAFKASDSIKSLEKFWVTEYQEITQEELEKEEKKLADYIENGNKVVNIDSDDEYNNQIIDYHDGNVLDMIDNGFSITGSIENGFPKL